MDWGAAANALARRFFRSVASALISGKVLLFD
jgi:hypothetical protein